MPVRNSGARHYMILLMMPFEVIAVRWAKGGAVLPLAFLSGTHRRHSLVVEACAHWPYSRVEAYINDETFPYKLAGQSSELCFRPRNLRLWVVNSVPNGLFDCCSTCSRFSISVSLDGMSWC